MNPAGNVPYPILLDREPSELLVADEPAPCPYFPDDREARMPLRLPLRPLHPPEWDGRLVEGDRRHGAVIYRTQCPTCSACEPIRVDVGRYVFSRNQRRVLRRARAALTVTLGPPTVDEERLSLYEKHLAGRDLRQSDHRAISPQRYRHFLVDSCVATFELRYRYEDQLIGVALTDRADRSLSAHYTFYDPAFSHLGIGTFSILEQIELCQRWDLDWLYLGLYIGTNQHMSYKSRFLPQQRLIGGDWRPFEKSKVDQSSSKGTPRADSPPQGTTGPGLMS